MHPGPVFFPRRRQKTDVTKQAIRVECVHTKTSVHEVTPGMWDGPDTQGVYLGCVVNAELANTGQMFFDASY